MKFEIQLNFFHTIKDTNNENIYLKCFFYYFSFCDNITKYQNINYIFFSIYEFFSILLSLIMSNIEDSNKNKKMRNFLIDEERKNKDIEEAANLVVKNELKEIEAFLEQNK
ncbi:hypothetical protein CWI38_1227p0020 [Hamiltosporidium tvaerminnensis]|uniref:Uncharacterized protein n=1 Tax=Hamiltosporidium tvaerminnensis TaxID=1176355 RepID=A0A4Q9LS63_9MICR|nr:hypothetical protein CWI38_1227p0020 [Hamiltosporidium tvaerminnensis]